MKNFTSTIILSLFSFILLQSYSTQAQTTATYDITFTSVWNAMDHSEIPNGAHWSNLVGATHSAPNEFIELGQNATLGIKNVAETGSNTAFNNEVDDAITANNANQWLQQSFTTSAAISSATLNDIVVTETHHLLTLVSMIAPSPDWLIAVNSLDLRTAANDGWRNTFTIDVFAYDAGTDGGMDYDSANNPVTPMQISMINGFPINGIKMGTLTVTLKFVLGIETLEATENVIIYPNPSEGDLFISNIQNFDLKSIKIYNTLGLLVKEIVANEQQNSMVLNLHDLNSGIYIINLESHSGINKTKKLLIK